MQCPSESCNLQQPKFFNVWAASYSIAGAVSAGDDGVALASMPVLGCIGSSLVKLLCDTAAVGSGCLPSFSCSPRIRSTLCTSPCLHLVRECYSDLLHEPSCAPSLPHRTAPTRSVSPTLHTRSRNAFESLHPPRSHSSPALCCHAMKTDSNIKT